MNILVRQPKPKQIDWTGVPGQLRGIPSAVVRNSHEAEALCDWYGSPEWVPASPVLLMLPTGPTFIGIDQTEHPMTARDLRDQAIQVFESEMYRMRADTRGLVVREGGGPVDRAEVQKQVQTALIRQQAGIF